MTTKAIAELIRAHNLPACIVGDCVATQETSYIVQTKETVTESKVFRAGTPRSDILNWLGY
jgi:hypothetical protein